jgi:hypothetical protein
MQRNRMGGILLVMTLASAIISMFKITQYIYEAVHRPKRTVPQPRDGDPRDPDPRDPGNRVHRTTDILLGWQSASTTVEDGSGWEADEKRQLLRMLERTNSTSRWQCEWPCEELQWPAEQAHHCSPWSRIPVTQVIMLASRSILIYQVCMLIMSNFAITNGCSNGCDSWVIEGFQHEVRQPMGSPRRLADVFQSSTVSKFTPGFMSRPSPYVFVAASMTWTLLEWAHYRSNPEHKYQLAILGLAVVLGLIPAIGSPANMVPVLFCTMPWAIDLGLLVSDILHSVQPRDRIF